MFEQMHTILPENEKGIARLEHFEITEHQSAMSSLRRGDFVPEGKYVRLYVNNSLYMSDTRMERITNSEIVIRANGKVLIAGLGVGLILIPILAKQEVESVTVIEKYQDVIDLVSPHFTNPKLNVIQSDVYEWQPERGLKFDTIYFDIWPDICTDNLEGIAKLHNRFKFKLNRTNPDAYMNSWQRDHLKSLKRSEDRYW